MTEESKSAAARQHGPLHSSKIVHNIGKNLHGLPIAMHAFLRLASGRSDLRFKVTVFTAVCLVGFFASYLLLMVPPYDQHGYVVGRDFVNTWMGARAVLSGRVGELFHIDVYMQALRSAFGPMPPHNWSYPPPLLLFIWPLGFLPYLAALAAWSLAGCAAYLGASAQSDRSLRTLAFVAVAPAVAVDLYSGQTGFFTAALMILFWRDLEERPVRAGVFLGTMICKPHLVVLFPLALALSGRWRTFLAAGASALVLAAAAALAFGADVWADYFRLVMPVQRGVLDTGTGFLSMMPTGFMGARMLGASPAVAWWVQVPFTLLAVAAVAWTFRTRRDPTLSCAVLLTASVMVTPYAFNYDMVVFGWLAAVLWSRFDRKWDRVLLLSVWALPVAMLPLGDLHLPVSAPLLAVFLVRLVTKVREREAAVQPSPSREHQLWQSDLPIEPRSFIASVRRSITPSSPARSQVRGS